MADGIKLEIDSKAVLQRIQDGLEIYEKTMAFQVMRALTILEAQIKQNIRKDAGLHVRTGALLNSVYKKVTIQGGAVIGEVGTQGVPYARIHEMGGTIFPVNKKFLAIPAEDNRNADGSPKLTTADLMGAYAKQTFIHNGIIFLATQQGKGKNMSSVSTPMFYLKKSVTIPQRPYIQPAIAAKQDEIMKNFGLFISAAFKTNSEG